MELIMEMQIVGIHHVTAIASDPQRNLDFYTELLGLRLVKRTVSFDDPGTYHLYFGDDDGTPGTILTFFPRPMAARGSPGVGQVTLTSFSVPEKSLGFWERRLRGAGAPVERSGKLFDEEVLTSADPDGLKPEIVGRDGVREPQAQRGTLVPEAHAIRGFYAVTISEQGFEATADVLRTRVFALSTSRATAPAFMSGKEAKEHVWMSCVCRRVDMAGFPRARCTTSPGKWPTTNHRKCGASGWWNNI